jgi:hypothetical protein
MIEASYAITAAEFGEAQKMWSSQNQRKLPGGQLMGTAYVLLSVGIGMSIHFLPAPLAAYLCVTFAAVLGIPYWRRIAIRRYVYAQATDRDEPVQLRIDDQGYSTVRPGFNECHMRWRCFTGWKEGKNVVVLGRGIQICIVPKNALDESQIQELRHLLHTHLQNT